MKQFPLHPICLSAALLCAFSPQAGAAFINNGGFESGFTNWIGVDQLGSAGTFALQTGTTSPVNGDAVPAPPGGNFAAMSDAFGPGAHVLYQDFVVPASVVNAMLVFDVYIGNRAGTFATPNTLDFSTPALNQQARVDILVGGAPAFSLAPADLLMNVYQTNVGDPAVSGYSHSAVDITSLLNSHLNTPLRIRFAETDNVFTFQMGVDNLDVVLSNVPEPASWIFASGGLLAVLGRAARRFTM